MTTDYNVLREADLVRAACHTTRKTRHTRNGAQLPRASLLRIVQFTGDEGIYLLRLDADGNELTDTLHDSIQDAMEQAEWEYGLQETHWRKL